MIIVWSELVYLKLLPSVPFTLLGLDLRSDPQRPGEMAEMKKPGSSLETSMPPRWQPRAELANPFIFPIPFPSFPPPPFYKSF